MCPGRHTKPNEIGKAPWLKDWPKLRLNAEGVRRMRQAYPHANIGVLTEPSGLLDIAPDSAEWLAEFERLGLPATFSYTSGGGEGHRHYLYQRPAGCPAAKINRSGEFDIQVSGLSVLPPSVHWSGVPYRCLTPPETPLPDGPAWAVDMLQGAAQQRVSATALVAAATSDEPPVRLSTGFRKFVALSTPSVASWPNAGP